MQVIDDKQKLKEKFDEALKGKDKFYVKQMQHMNDKIDELIQRMKDQFIKIRWDYAVQLKEIEKEFEKERQALLEQNTKEISALFTKHQETEKKFLELRTENEKQYTTDLEN